MPLSQVGQQAGGCGDWGLQGISWAPAPPLHPAGVASPASRPTLASFLQGEARAEVAFMTFALLFGVSKVCVWAWVWALNASFPEDTRMAACQRASALLCVPWKFTVSLGSFCADTTRSTHTHTHINIYICTHIHKHPIYIYTPIHTHIHTCTYTYALHTYMYIHIYIHTYSAHGCLIFSVTIQYIELKKPTISLTF